MYIRLLIFILILLNETNQLVIAERRFPPKRYEFGDVLIEAFHTIGLRVSIPELDANMKRFEFHGNINVPIDVADDGSLAKFVSGGMNGRWTIIFNDIKINENDKIYFWFEVLINDDVYRYKNREVTIQSLSYLNNSTLIPSYSMPEACESPVEKAFVPHLDIDALKKRLASVTKDIEILKKIVKINEKIVHDRKLLLNSNRNHEAAPNYATIIEEFFENQLNYYGKPVENIEITDCGILFDVETCIDKAIILQRFAEYRSAATTKQRWNVIDPKLRNCLNGSLLVNDEIDNSDDIIFPSNQSR